VDVIQIKIISDGKTVVYYQPSFFSLCVYVRSSGVLSLSKMLQHPRSEEEEGKVVIISR